MIIVTGATGRLGRAIIEKLAQRVAADRIAASARDPGKAADLEAIGVRVRRGDFDDRQSLEHAFKGGTHLLIVSSNARATGGDPLAQHRNAIDAARAAGVRRIVYTSHMAASASSAFPPMLDHAATEAMLAESGLPWTALRHGFYAASGIDLMGDGLRTGVIEAPADGKVAWTAHDDLAEAAAIVLADAASNDASSSYGAMFDGPTPPFTGAEALDLADMAAIASERLGRPVRRDVLTDDDLRAKMAARGAPARAADMVLGLHEASRNGEFAPVHPTLERLLGRPPIAMRALIEAKVEG